MKRFKFFSPKVWLTLCLGLFLIPWWLGFAMPPHQVVVTQVHKNRSSSRFHHHGEQVTPMMLVDVEVLYTILDSTDFPLMRGPIKRS
jgi:hypothetical protein